jgi:hypothetical protein
MATLQTRQTAVDRKRRRLRNTATGHSIPDVGVMELAYILAWGYSMLSTRALDPIAIGTQIIYALR